MTLQEYKKAKIEEMSNLSFNLRQKVVPDYKVQNALLGLYDDSVMRKIRQLCYDFRVEYYRLDSSIKNAKTELEIDEICTNNKFDNIK